MSSDQFKAAAIQADVRSVGTDTDPDRVRRTVEANLDRHMELVEDLWKWTDSGPELIVFPEFCLTMPPQSPEDLDAFQKIGVEIPGYVTDIIGDITSKYDIFIAMNTYEKDPEWPGRVFNTSFIVDPDGEVILRYRKLNSTQLGMLPYSQPGDFYEDYIDHYGGPEALFPVADTRLGNLACLTCYDIRYSEVARCLALQGAEVLLHPTGEPNKPVHWRQSWDRAKSVRAWENQCYFISANTGRILDGTWPEFRQAGNSKILGPDGGVIAQIEGQGESVISCEINVGRLRNQRYEKPGRNVPMTSRFWMYEPIFEAATSWPEGVAAETSVTRDKLRAAKVEARDRAVENGIFVEPSED